MSNLRRYYKDGSVYFVTSVTLDRSPILRESANLLLSAMTKRIAQDCLIAWVILPDHFHAVIDPKDENLSNLMRRTKLNFSSDYRLLNQLRSGRLWQYRFWDHVIRDQADMNFHIDYCHYNPVKHGYVLDPKDWKWSSLSEYLQSGLYFNGWGVKDAPEFEGEFGE